MKILPYLMAVGILLGASAARAADAPQAAPLVAHDAQALPPPPPSISPDDARTILSLLGGVTLTGNQAPAFVELAKRISAVAALTPIGSVPATR